MRLREVKELFRTLSESYFTKASVVYANESRAPKHDQPLVTLAFGNVKRAAFPPYEYIDGYPVGYYPSEIEVTVDLFTNGMPVYKNDKIVSYDNTASDDMLSFMDFLNSPHVTKWSADNDIAILFASDVQDLTGLKGETTYEYRARLVLKLCFTHRAIGASGLLSESSIRPND